jgi:hypothetical protein
MTSTLFIRKTPKPTNDQIAFKQPIKGMITRRYYNHDGSLGGNLVTVPPSHLAWWEGLLAGGDRGADEPDIKNLDRVVEMLRDGDSIDLWFEV